MANDEAPGEPVAWARCGMVDVVARWVLGFSTQNSNGTLSEMPTTPCPQQSNDEE